jgi:aspartate/methionine/tyrosine aminotransferase
MGAILAGCRGVPYDDLDAVDDADGADALCLWVNSPANPTGALADLGAAAAWGRARGVPVLSDECYAEFTWDGLPHTILEQGLDGVLAVHSLSKRSNLAGLRVGFYAGDPELVHSLAEVRKHAGFMVPGPVQAAAVVALDDDAHVDEQRERYLERLWFFADVLRSEGAKVDLPGGSFYLWAEVTDGDAWAFTTDLARRGGVLVSPGDLYGPGGAGCVRVAMVQPMDRLRLATARLTAG